MTVLILEKGFVKDSLLSRIPLMSQNFLFGDKLQVVGDRFSEPSPEANGAKIKLWTAEGLGGASRISGMVMTRGTPADYNAWAQDMSLDDWAWERVEPFFRKSENDIGCPTSEARGHDGKLFRLLSLSLAPLTSLTPKIIRSDQDQAIQVTFRLGTIVGLLSISCLDQASPKTDLSSSLNSIEKAAQAVGLPIIDDVNDPAAPAMGFYRLDQAVNERAERNTSYQAFLNERLARTRRAHLTVCTGASASRLKLDEDNDSVLGVFVRSNVVGKSTSDIYVAARREVIVCCGAFKTAQLLMLSGIGPRDHLQANGIPVLQELPVGQFLSDHFAFPITLELPKKETMHMLQSAIYGLWHILLWLFFGTGLMASNCIPNTMFVRSRAIDDKTMSIQEHDPESDANNMDISQPQNIPDIEIMFFAVNGLKRLVPDRSVFTLYPCLVQPHSQGRVELADSNPLSHPKITHPLLRSQEDWPVARKAIRFAMRLAQEFQRSGYPHAAPFAFAPGNEVDKLAQWELQTDDEPFVTAAPAKTSQSSAASKSPDPGKTWDTVTDDEIDRYIRCMASASLHPSCTCRMSNDPQLGVVDQRLRVHGVHNLRIADTSVFPRMLSSHTMWPAIMVGERCADFIKKDWGK